MFKLILMLQHIPGDSFSPIYIYLIGSQLNPEYFSKSYIQKGCIFLHLRPLLMDCGFAGATEPLEADLSSSVG